MMKTAKTVTMLALGSMVVNVAGYALAEQSPPVPCEKFLCQPARSQPDAFRLAAYASTASDVSSGPAFWETQNTITEEEIDVPGHDRGAAHGVVVWQIEDPKDLG